jgi:hypothetical protein
MNAVATRVPRLEHVGRVTQGRILLSEWTKLRSLRSNRIALFMSCVLTIGFPILFAAIVASHWDRMTPAERANRQPLDFALSGVGVAHLVIGVLGVVVMTSEYSTGLIRATFCAVPKRLPVLWAKAMDFALVAFALMLPSAVVAFFASQAVLERHHILQISFAHPGVARCVICSSVYLMLVGVFALALGAIVRHTAGGIGLFVTIFFVIPPLVLVLPTSWSNAISPYLPSAAGRAMVLLAHGPHELAPGPGAALFCGYVTLALAGAAVLLVRRDA